MVIYTHGCIYNHWTILSPRDDVTTKHFYEKILDLNGNKWFQLAITLFSNINGAN